MVFQYLKDNNIMNFGFLIKLEDQTNLSILLDNHELINDIVIDSDEAIYNTIDDYEMCIVGITITDDENNIVFADDLEEDDISEMTYTIVPLFLYRVKTIGLKMEDFVEMDLMNILFYDVLDEYIKERNE